MAKTLYIRVDEVDKKKWVGRGGGRLWPSRVRAAVTSPTEHVVNWSASAPERRENRKEKLVNLSPFLLKEFFDTFQIFPADDNTGNAKHRTGKLNIRYKYI